MTTHALRRHGDSYAAAGLLDFAVNVRPIRPPGLARVLEAALAGAGYPDDREAREAIAAHHGLEPAEVLTLNGACEGFWLLALALRPRRATVIQPSFSEGELALRAAGAAVERAILRAPGWALDVEAVDREADFVVVTNPNNPTGRLEPAATVAALARPGRILLVDESFMDFASDAETLARRSEVPGLVVLRSCTKLLSLAGVRAGYLLADRQLTATLAAHRQPWPVSSVACAALRYAATERAVVGELVVEARRDCEDLRARHAAIAGVDVFPSAANFLLARTRRSDVPERLRDVGIAVRPAAGFPGLDSTYFRVAARGPEDNRRFAAALELLLADG